jgi:hypothetical protein
LYYGVPGYDLGLDMGLPDQGQKLFLHFQKKVTFSDLMSFSATPQISGQCNA